MKKQVCVCIFIACVFCISIPNSVLGQGIPLAQQVFRKHKQTLQRADIQEILPRVLEGLKAPDNQRFLNPLTINLVVDNPDLLPIFIPDIEPKFVALLKVDWALKNLLRDPLVQELLQSPAAIDELARLLGVGGDAGRNLPDLPARQIYDQATPSVVWITTIKEDWIGKGSGVLIDRKRRLVVTNEHVIRGAEWVHVFFPYEGRNGLEIEEAFYVNNWEWLERNGYATEARVIRQNVKNDLAIIQLRHLPLTAREIKHDFSRNVEDSMKKGDTVHILGNPGIQLWNWDRGVFVSAWRNCLPSGGDCLEMEAGVRGGNSGGPVLNGQGMLIGILAAGNDETGAAAAPARNVKTLLATVPAHLLPVPPKVFPKRTFKIRNHTGVTVPYQIKWSDGNNWKSHSLRTGFIITHRSNGQNVPANYPKIQFDHIAGDGQVTYRVYNLESAIGNTNVAPTYRFEFNQWRDRLDLYRDGFASPTLSREVPKETVLLSNYPNPFNPETWIPYQLAKPAKVTVSIYATDGTLVRTLALGHQPAGVYQDKSRAAYWDGKNELGEPVASGVYFYTLKAGNFTATRKMLIRK